MLAERFGIAESDFSRILFFDDTYVSERGALERLRSRAAALLACSLARLPRVLGPLLTRAHAHSAHSVYNVEGAICLGISAHEAKPFTPAIWAAVGDAWCKQHGIVLQASLLGSDGASNGQRSEQDITWV